MFTVLPTLNGYRRYNGHCTAVFTRDNSTTGYFSTRLAI